MDQVKSDKKPIGVFCDGCYDIFHYGHANQILQAKKMGDFLVAGIHSDAVIAANKGPPVIEEKERYRIMRSLRWVDDVAEGIEYELSTDMLDKAGCAFYVHGDDIIVSSNGQDANAFLRSQDRYKECRRTDGISTTDLVGRMILLTSDHHSLESSLAPKHLEIAKQLALCPLGKNPWVSVYQFDPKSNKISRLIEGRDKKSTDRIVYVDGNFDLFHIGHLQFLEEASKRGDYLIVGVHADFVVNTYKGTNYPIMTLHERVLSLLGCRYINALLIGAPYVITEELMIYFGVDIVLHGQTSLVPDRNGRNPYEISHKLGKLEFIDSGSQMSTAKIVERIIENRLLYETRNEKVEKKMRAAMEEMLKKMKNANESTSLHG